MNTDQLITVQYTKLLWSYKNILIRNVLIAAILTSVLALIISKTYKSTAILMPPKSQSDQGILANIEGLAFGDFLSTSSDEVSNTIFAILKSRTMMESIVNTMGLIQRYESDNLEEAVKSLRDNLSFEQLEEGTISISANVHTPWLSNEQDEIEARNLATKIANEFVNQLDIVNKRLQTEQAIHQRKFLGERYGENLMDLIKAEEKLKQFKENHNIISIESQTRTAIESAAALKNQILIKEVQKGVVSRKLKLNHPEIIGIEDEIRELTVKLHEIEYGRDTSENVRGNLFLVLSEIPQIDTDLMRLTREVDIQSGLYVFLTQKYEESKIQEARDTPTIQILDDASSPIKRLKPKRTIMVLGYSLIAFVLSALYVILLEFNTPGKRSS